ncbi:rRNA biogenesis protein RRP36-like [Macadamia integrifolia]|uniref:rRNA biogenesis protein RRP36-like n=1 Tax=Macadamia integrifolia TaxID=60698 RepID=UPI001C52A127|nr:rRNA biogenesis protein RRP36-like [Macadamia integrifolia]
MKIKKSDHMVATSSKHKLDESDENESSSEEEEELERELADFSFEELQKARSNGFQSLYEKPNPEKKVGRANKNRPMEISSKKPVSRFREVIQVPKRKVSLAPFPDIEPQFRLKQFFGDFGSTCFCIEG